MAMSAWAQKDLPARLQVNQVAKILNCSNDDVTVLMSAGKLKPLGKPRPNAVKYFSSIELMIRVADQEWLDDATKAIATYWRRKNERRKNSRTGLDSDAQGQENDDFTVKKPSTKSSTISSISELKSCSEREISNN